MWCDNRHSEDEEGCMIIGKTTPRSSESDDTWRDMLRQGWREELASMNKSKAAVLQPKVNL
jgi:hypothetical protein